MVKKLERIFQRGKDGSESTGKALSGMFFKDEDALKQADNERLAAEDYEKIRAERSRRLGEFVNRGHVVVWGKQRDGLLRPGARHDQELEVPTSHQESQAA